MTATADLDTAVLLAVIGSNGVLAIDDRASYTTQTGELRLRPKWTLVVGGGAGLDDQSRGHLQSVIAVGVLGDPQ